MTSARFPFFLTFSLVLVCAQGPGQCGVVSAGHRRGGGGCGPPDPLHLDPGVLLRERHQHPAGEQHEAACRNPGRGQVRRGAHGPALCSSYGKCVHITHLHCCSLPFWDLFSLLLFAVLSACCASFINQHLLRPPLLQSPLSSPWNDPALSKVNRFCRDSRCLDQWVPVINLPDR